VEPHEDCVKEADPGYIAAIERGLAMGPEGAWNAGKPVTLRDLAQLVDALISRLPEEQQDCIDRNNFFFDDSC
jgi:hypothetical protein